MTAPARNRHSSASRRGARATTGTATTRADAPTSARDTGTATSARGWRPTRGRTSTRSGGRTPRAQPTRSGRGTGRGSAGERAYAKRAQRAEASRRSSAGEGGSLARRPRWPRSRASFVLVLMALMAVGVATTLWLSTQAIADSYRLERLRQQNAHLAERAEQLQREVGRLQSPSSLAERAKALGMVPGGNPARLVVDEDGSITVVGEPTEATAPPVEAGATRNEPEEQATGGGD